MKRFRHSWLVPGVIWIALSAGVTSADEADRIAETEEPAAVAESPGEPADDLTDLSLEDLMNVQVRSVAKKEQLLSEVAAAVTVITADDVRRGGHTSIAEALRLVPGMQVARVSADAWAISARGFNDRFSNKLLVLLDGRSVYTPLFGGVYWDVQDIFFEDLDRIEVIRGPGATLWGSNAVNGVVNVTTKSAEHTQGFVASGGAGIEETGYLGARFGGRLGENSYFRVYGKGLIRDDGVNAMGADTADEFWQARGGFRVDGETGGGDRYTVQGDAYTGISGEAEGQVSLTPPNSLLVPGDVRVGGGNLLARLHRVGERSSWTAQAYVDHTQRDGITFDEVRTTFDVEWEHHFRFLDRHALVWGLGYRVSADRTEGGLRVSGSPADRTLHLGSAFVQDEFTLLDGKAALTVGTKVEQNSLTGFEIQPGIRGLWKVARNHRLWAALSRSVRTSSRALEDIVLNLAVVDVMGTPAFVRILGNPAMPAEELISAEWGWRWQATPELFLDVAGFYNEYDNLSTIEPAGAPFGEGAPLPPHLVVPRTFMALKDGQSYGVEISGTWKPRAEMRFSGGYSFLRLQLHAPNSLDPSASAAEGQSPQHTVFLRGQFDLRHNLELDTGIYYVDRLAGQGIPSYFRLDFHVGWRPDDRTRIDIGLQNLTDNAHPEFRETFAIAESTETQTSVYFRITRIF